MLDEDIQLELRQLRRRIKSTKDVSLLDDFDEFVANLKEHLEDWQHEMMGADR